MLGVPCANRTGGGDLKYSVIPALLRYNEDALRDHTVLVGFELECVFHSSCFKRSLVDYFQGTAHASALYKHNAYETLRDLLDSSGFTVGSAGDSYHGHRESPDWRRMYHIGFDRSVRANEPLDLPVEIITPVLAFPLAVKRLFDLISLLKANGAYTNDSCGLHVNMSVGSSADVRASVPNPGLFVLLSDEGSLRKVCLREDNHYCVAPSSVITASREAIAHLLCNHYETMASSAVNVLILALSSYGKYAALNYASLSRGWFEYRGIGGDYLSWQTSKLRHFVDKICQAYSLSTLGDLCADRYITKMYSTVNASLLSNLGHKSRSGYLWGFQPYVGRLGLNISSDISIACSGRSLTMRAPIVAEDAFGVVHPLTLSISYQRQFLFFRRMSVSISGAGGHNISCYRTATLRNAARRLIFLALKHPHASMRRLTQCLITQGIEPHKALLQSCRTIATLCAAAEPKQSSLAITGRMPRRHGRGSRFHQFMGRLSACTHESILTDS